MPDNKQQPRLRRGTRGQGRRIHYPDNPEGPYGEKLLEQTTENEDGSLIKEVLYAIVDGEKITFQATAEKEDADANSGT